VAGVRRKLGLGGGVDDAAAQELCEELVELLEHQRVDYTSFFRRLADGAVDEPFEGWATRWRSLGPDVDAMQRVNPVYIPRNHLVEEALTAASSGDMELFDRLLRVVSSPYDERPGFERYAEPAPEDFGSCFQTFCGT
jgi:uncharacterized protein YdiU (UPF0061 family)